MKNIKYLLYILTLVIKSNVCLSLTNISSGSVSGTWTKSGSPYLINGDVYVPFGQTLRITKGVKIEFQGSYAINVWGSIQALGETNDTVVFTPKVLNIGWKGVYIHKNQTGADSNLIKFCKFEYAKFFDYSMFTNVTRGAMRCDTVNNILIENSRFYKNTSNLGAGIRGFHSVLVIRNCQFHFNSGIDERSSVPSGFFGGGSAIGIGGGSLTISNCIFNRNICHAPNDSRDTTLGLGQGVIVCANASFSMTNSIVRDNMCTSGFTVQLSPILSGNKTYLIRNCDFINNINGFEPIVQINNEGNVSGMQTNIENCRFINNINTRGDFKSICLYAYNLNGGGNKIGVKNCLFYKNSANKSRCNVIQMTHEADVTILNSRFIGNKAIGVVFFNSGKLRIDNSIFSNNYVSIQSGIQTSTSNIVLNNSTFVNNGIPFSDTSRFKGTYQYPLFTYAAYGPENINIYNSIFWGNIGDNGRPANLFTESNRLGGKIKLAQNNYIQWGQSSTSNNKGGAANITTYSGNYSDTLIFVNPSAGFGPENADTLSDWKLLNTCNIMPSTYNKGLASIKDGNGVSLNLLATDLSGNKRVQLDTLDIGPFEISGLKARTILKQNPIMDSICFSEKKLIRSSWDGLGLTYTWEKSLDGVNNWQFLQSSDSSNLFLQIQNSAYYRVKAIQTECGRINTSTPALIKLRPLPEPLALLKGDSACSGNSVRLNTSWKGQQLIYTWQKSKDGISGWQNLQTADTSSLNFKPTENAYYKVRVKTSGCSIDSVSNIVAGGTFPNPKPYLGNDTAIKQNQNLLLNPGTFNIYQWNTGVITPTLTINGSIEPLGIKTYWVKVNDNHQCHGTDTINVTIEKNTSLDHLFELGWKIFPVPNNGALTIESPHGSPFVYSIYDIQGKFVKDGSGDLGSSKIELSKGQFILIIESENRIYKTLMTVL